MRRFRHLTFPSTLGGLGLAGTALFAPTARAEQFTLVDVSYKHGGTSHYNSARLHASVPADWTGPVDFSTGRAYMRLEVKGKPNQTQATAFQFCMGQSAGYTCSPYGTFRTTGVVEWSKNVRDFWTNNGRYDWKQRPRSISLIVKDTRNGAIDPGGKFVGAPDLGLYYPLDVRFVVAVVKAGDSLQRDVFGPPVAVVPRDAGASAPPADGPRDGGPPDEAPADAGDAATPADAKAPAPPPPAAAPPSGGVRSPDPAEPRTPERPRPGPTPGAPTGEVDEEPAPSPRSQEAGGCAVGGGSTRSTPLALLVAGILSLGLGRRRHPRRVR
jgi:hypothetical protein